MLNQNYMDVDNYLPRYFVTYSFVRVNPLFALSFPFCFCNKSVSHATAHV